MNVVSLDPSKALDDAITSIGAEERLVICGPPAEEDALNKRLAIIDATAEELIEASLAIDVEVWFREQREDLESEWEEDLSEREGEWPGEASVKQGFMGTIDIRTGKPFKEVIGVRVPVRESWKLPAHLQYGGWNDCPEPDVQCAIWRYWEAKYGATIIAASDDVLEAYVAAPPQTEDEAMALAWEQCLYCYDIVDQGAETVANLAAGLINHPYWYFRWD